MSGELMAAEMREQPERLRALVARAEEIRAIVRSLLGSAQPAGVTIVARGSSDHAATCGRYLIEAACGRPVSKAAPSLHTLYRIPADYRGQLVVAVSQSGETPEIVTTLERLCEAGGVGLAITNDPSSPLAAAAHATLALEVGEERAVPATKTVTAQLVAFAILSSALGEAPFADQDLAMVPDAVQSVLDDPEPAVGGAEAVAGCTRLVMVARGFLYGAALEGALKVKETCGLLADGYSSADLRHGPIAAVTPEVPVVALSAPGPAHPDLSDLAEQLRARGVTVLTVGADDGSDMSLPEWVPEPLASVPAVVRTQQLARELSLRLGLDPDAPAGLTKVTAT